MAKKALKQIASFEEACAHLGIGTEVPDFSMAPAEDRKGFEAHYKLAIIAKAIRNGKNPDWDNGKWDKFFPWFRMGSSGVGFSCRGCGGGSGASAVGSRLCLNSSDDAEYMGQQFKDLYKEYFTIGE